MEINDKTIKLLSTIGPRASFGMGVLDLVKEHKDLMVITCDVSTSAGLDRFRKTYPDQYLDLGIAEQNMIGVAAGLASENYKVITTTFAPFQTMRCCEQIKVNLGYMKEKITMVGLASGLVLGNLGYTHCCIEDMGVLRTIPNLTIISPSDSLETIKAVEASLKYNQSCYIRLTGGPNNTIVNSSDYDFKIGKAIVLNKGKDVVLIANGSVVSEAIKAAKILENKNISATVINMHTAKPIDSDIILKSIINSKLFVTIEEHNIFGGIGSAVSEVLATVQNHPPLIKIGIDDQYKFHGGYKYLLQKYGLLSNEIVTTILKFLK